MRTGRLGFLRHWVVPEGFHPVLDTTYMSALLEVVFQREVLTRNAKYRGIHRGERCFVLANGPSVKQQDIRPLRNEHVLSVSSGYQHPDYALVAPRYHCVPQLTYQPKFTPEIALHWFKEMHERLGRATLFLALREREMVKQNGLFSGREVGYLCLGGTLHASRSIPDPTRVMPRVATVPVMAILLAMYMGFRDIYLLGTDHDWFVRKEYRYFYEPTVLKGTDSGTTPDGRIETTIFDELPNIIAVWTQYRALRQIADRCGARIFNATEGGMLDEFPRVQLETLFARS